MSSRSLACTVLYGCTSIQARRAFGLRCLNTFHSFIVAVPRPARASTHDSLSETKRTKSPFALRLLSFARGALQFVPPPPIEARRSALVITLPRGLIVTLTTLCSNGSTSARGFLRNTAAATSAATSTHRTADVAPSRNPVTGDDIDPETSGQT